MSGPRPTREPDTIELKRLLGIAQEAAGEAGDVLLRRAGRLLDVEAETGRDVKLKADREAERIVLEKLTASAPYPVYSEEAGFSGTSVPGRDDALWIVDPLDGTFNYQRGQPGCCCSIALMLSGEPALGVVHDFNRGETYAGIVGEGAWLDGREIATSNAAAPGDAVLMTGFPVNRDFSPEALAASARQWAQWKKVRMIGSAALSLAWVACGRADAYSEERVMSWDVAAGLALVKAAGGKTGFPQSDPGEPGDVWATNSRLSVFPPPPTA